MPFFIFHGNDIKLLRRELKKWEEDLFSQNPQMEVYAPESPVLPAILEKISSDSLFGEKQLLKIYDFEKIPGIEKIWAYPGDHFTVLISYEKKNPLAEKKLNAEVRSFNLPRSYEIEKILVQRFRGKIAAEAMEYLSRNITSLVDLDELESRMEEENLSFLSMDDLFRLKGDTEARIFLLVENILNQKITSAVLEVNAYLEAGGYAGTLVAQLNSQLNKIYFLKIMQEKNVTSSEIASQLSMHPFIVQKLSQTASLYSRKKLEKLLLALPRLEYHLRYYDPVFSPYFLEKFILETTEA